MDTNQTAITQLTSFKGQQDEISSALAMAIVVLTTGYQSDTETNEAAIAAGVSSGIDSAVKAATDPLNAQIVDLEQQINELQPSS